jgi:glycosyltransferase involved in cell wall biosynthesis
MPTPLSSRGSTVSVVVAARNEARNIAFGLQNLPVGVEELILVDGHSADDTIAVAQRLLPGIRVVRQARRGKGNALVAGFQATTGRLHRHDRRRRLDGSG